MKKIYLFGTVIAIFFTALFIQSNLTNASPEFFLLPNAETATTTVNYMTPGTATTTIYFNSYASGNTTGAKSATLNIQYTATNTASMLKWRYEFARNTSGVDCTVRPTACDWYSETVDLGGTASTTIEVRNFKEYSWLFASSSQGAAGVATNNNRALKTISVPTPMQYVRAIFYVPTGVSNGGVWASFVAKKEQ